MRDYMDWWVTPPACIWVTFPMWGPPPPCKQALKLLPLPIYLLFCPLNMNQQQHDNNLRRTRIKNPSLRWDLNPRPSVI